MGDGARSTDEIHRLVHDRLAQDGQLYTTGRRQLVDLLAEAGRPVTMPALLEAHPELAVSSAYRNLAVLEAVGLVARITGSGEHAHFELAEGVRGGHHHHLICSSCGRVDDFTVPQRLERTLERAVSEVASELSFTTSAHRLDLVGTCGECGD